VPASYLEAVITRPLASSPAALPRLSPSTPS